MAVEHFDVLIVGAGLSGIGAGVHLQKNCPNKRYVILEARPGMGGTWDLFKYPGIRSDSDMFTLGYEFKPWKGRKAIADGADILDYIHETARENGIQRHIRFGHKAKRISWSSAEAKWTVEVERSEGRAPLRFTCNFLYNCSGYYNYDAGYTPDFPGVKDFKGQLVHPQKWPKDLDYRGKKVVVIGSGATAITLIPSMTDKAQHVTMLQRSPTYIISIPDRDVFADFFRKLLPASWAYALVRWKNVILTQLVFFNLSRLAPDFVRGMLRLQNKKLLGPGFDVDTHFKPKYKPWDQRVCMVPNADLFKAMRRGKAAVVTDHIERFTAGGIQLKSGQTLAADIVVTATGLELQLLGGMQVVVDGRTMEPNQAWVYKGMMVSDLPNLAIAVGYTNASWSLKCDLISKYVCRILNHMDRHGYAQCAPRRNDPSLTEEPMLDLTSGYVQRAAAHLPKQGSKVPWKLYQNYAFDLLALKFCSLEDGVLEFSGKTQPLAAEALQKAA